MSEAEEPAEGFDLDLMEAAAQRISELEAERDDFRNRWLKAELKIDQFLKAFRGLTEHNEQKIIETALARPAIAGRALCTARLRVRCTKPLPGLGLPVTIPRADA